MTSIIIKNIDVTVGDKNILSIPETIEIPQKSKVAVLGPNGAGKTTLLNCILRQTAFYGTIDPRASPKNSAVVLQKNEYNGLMKVGELVQIFLECSTKDPRYESLLEEYSLKDLENSQIQSLSGGEQQRLTLALSLYKYREYYFFDEISSGIDFQKRQQLTSLIHQKTKNATVLNISHYFEELQDWATHILLINGGKLVFYGTPQEFYRDNHHMWAIELDQPIEHLLAKDEINKYKHQGYFVFLDTEQEKQEITALLEKNGHGYKTTPQNLASTYAFVIGEEKLGIKPQNHDNTVKKEES